MNHKKFQAILKNTKTSVQNKKSFTDFAKNNSTIGFGILFNIIGFSFINEIYGEKIGNDVLYKVSIYLSTLYDIELFKLNGDNFLLLVKNYDFENAHKKYKKIVNKIDIFFKEHLSVNEYKIKINYNSVGGMFKYQNMLLNLNIHLKKIKEKKLHSFFIEKDEISIVKNNYMNILNIIDDAIKNNSIFLEFQPIVKNKTKNKIINKYETLVRIKHENKIIYPDKFINIAQQTNYYPLLTETVVALAFKRFYNKKNIEFSINLDILDIQNAQTRAFILSMLEDFPYPQNVVFELLEINKIEDYSILVNFIKKVQFLNARIALDDFGSGYSNYKLLSKINFNFIKIDGSLIQNINNFKISSIVESIVFFAKANNVKTIAEFVSSEGIYNKVLDLDIDYSQGWYFAKSDVCLIQKITPKCNISTNINADVQNISSFDKFSEINTAF